ncbi:MAG: phosphoenolpyruvate--protein phosphotransferase [Vicinamibacterales bacterium]
MRRLTGIGVSSGVAVGRAVILNQRARALRYFLAPGKVETEAARLERSRELTRQQLQNIRARVERMRGRDLAGLFDAQILMLDDPMIVPRAADFVRAQQVNAEWALQQVFDEVSAVFDEIADPYLRERKGDVADLVGRLRLNLRREGATAGDLLRELDESSVLIADELTPSLAAQVDWSRVGGFATDAGSRTYHTAILARSLDVPAVVGLHDASTIVKPGQTVVIDAASGELIVEPDDEVLRRALRSAQEASVAEAARPALRSPVATADGVRIRVEANVEFPGDLPAARYAGAEGIGLYRSEFLLADGVDPATEDAQYAIYRGMLEEMSPKPVTIRTFDVDEEQLARSLTGRSRDEAAAPGDERVGRDGLRGLRLGLTRPEVLRTQLRALLRAARHGSLRIMFPFVSGVEQVRAARRLLTETADDLGRQGEPVPQVPVGIMIEIPAAAYVADLLAREVDFFTIGTNDLIQYCLAVDRADDRVSTYYEPLHPAILRVIASVRRAADRRRIPVSLCGEMASDPAILPLLVGLGLREFSMTPGAIGTATQVLSEMQWDDLRRLGRRVLRLSTVQEIDQALMAVLGRPSMAGE